MYPSNKYPHYGVFVYNTEKTLRENQFEIDRAVMYKQDTKMKKILEYFKFYLDAIYLAKKNTYDAIYGHYASHIAIPILLIKKIRPRLKVIINVHGNDIVPEEKKDERYIELTKKLLSISNLIISPSQYFNEILINDYIISKEKIEIYPSGGINTKRFVFMDKSKAKEKMNLKSENQYIGFVSRIEIKKGWDVLLRAIKILDSVIDTKIKFLFVGDGSEKEKFNNMIQKLGIKDRIIYENFKSQDELVYVYNSLDIFCFPTYRKSESLGLVGLEAMSCGQILIASDMGGPKTYIKDGENGFLFEPEDEEKLAKKIQKILEMDNEYKRMISNNAIRTANRYSEEKVSKILIDIFEKM